MADESRLRLSKWLKYGCNAFEASRQASMPMSFWTEQDVLQYLVEYNVPYASVYGEIYQEQDGTYRTTGCNRTGCVFCMFGCHLEKGEKRFQKLAKTHPKLYNYCMNGGEEVNGVWQPNNDGLGLAKILDYIGVDYTPHEPLKSKKLFDVEP